VDREPGLDFPRVLQEALEEVVGHVVDDVLGGLLVLRSVSGQEVGKGVAAAAAVPGRELDEAVAVAVAGLLVDDVLVVDAALEGVRSQDLGQVALARELALGGVEDGVEPAGVVEQRAVVAPAAGVDRRDLVVALAENALIGIAEGLARDLAPIVDRVR